MSIVKGIVEVVVNVRDLAGMQRFYEETLGLTVHSAYPEDDPTIVFLTVRELDSPLGRDGAHPQLLALVDVARHAHARRFAGPFPRSAVSRSGRTAISPVRARAPTARKATSLTTDSKAMAATIPS